MTLFDDYKNVTMLQKYFLSLMAVQEISEEKNFMLKFDALCKANGVKIPENNDSDFRSRMLLKQHNRIRDE